MRDGGARIGVAAVVATLFGAATNAHAAVRCVAPASGSQCAATYSSLPDAVAAGVDGDTIELGAASYPGGLVATKKLNFIGIGAGSPAGATDPSKQSVIEGSSLSARHAPALFMNAGGSVTGIRLIGVAGVHPDFTGEGAPEPGLDLTNVAGRPVSYVVNDVIAIGGDYNPLSELIPGPGLRISSSSGPVSVAAKGGVYRNGVLATGTAVRATLTHIQANSSGPCTIGSEGARLTLVDSVINGGEAACGGGLTILRSSLFGYLGLAVGGAGAGTAPVSIRDSLIVGSGAGIEVAGPIRVSAVFSTVLDSGGPLPYPQHGGAVVADGGGAKVTFRNSVASAQHVDPTIADLVATGAGSSINASTSSFTTTLALNGSVVTKPGAAGNIAGDPDFVAPNGGNFSLAPGSPLIDRGDPAIVLSGERDLNGHPRSVDGRRDCMALPDIGAIEFIPTSGPCTPLLARLSLSRSAFSSRPSRRAGVRQGTTFHLTLSRSARVIIEIARLVPGITTRGRCKAISAGQGPHTNSTHAVKLGAITVGLPRGRVAIVFSGRLNGRALTPGSYRATVIAAPAGWPISRPVHAAFRVVGP